MYKKILAVLLIFGIVFSMTGCANKPFLETILDFSANYAENRLEKYLKEKYPDKTFCDITPEKGVSMLSNTLELDNTEQFLCQSFSFKDESGNEYKALVNTFGVKTTGNFDIADTVQKKEIENAINEKLCTVFNVQEDEQNYFFSYYMKEYASKKFEGDLEDFLEKDDFARATKSTSVNLYTLTNYFYCDKAPDYSKVNEEETQEFLDTFVQISFVKFNNTPKKELFDNLGFFETFACVGTRLMDITNLKVFGTTTKADGISDKTSRVVKDGDLYYTKLYKDFDELNFKVDEPVELSKWEEAISEYQTKNNEQWSKYNIISDTYKSEGGYIYFVEKPETTKENVVYKLFMLSEDKTEIKDIFSDIKATKIDTIESPYAKSCVVDNYFYIGPEDVKDDTTWFIVECEKK